MNVLIVDDEYGPRESLRMILKKAHTVYTADNGEKALDILGRFPIDLVTLDLRMPGMTGIDVLKRIRDGDQQIDVVIITGYGTFDSAVEGIRCGVMDFISKPFSVPEILSIVESAGKRKQLRESLESEDLRGRIDHLEEHLAAITQLSKAGELAALYAHEIKNPLGAISLRAQASLHEVDESASPKVARNLESIVTQAQRISKITNDLLRLSHPSGSEYSNRDVHTILEEMLNFFSVQLKTKNITIQKMFDRSIPPVFVDPDKMLQVFLNLVINSFKVLDEGGIVLIKTVLDKSSDGRGNSMVRIDFTDNGPGITPELQEKIFDPFFTTDRESGSGLGLHVCQKILKEHNGSIFVTSIPGEGATFSVLLPVAGEQKT